MATIVLRSVKGAALTHTEMDDNFNNLNTDKLENAGDTITGALVFNTGAGTDASVSESGVDRSSASAETFNVQNSGAGAMTLQVDGNTVWHAGNDGAGSTLDADTLDGLEGSAYALDSDVDDLSGVTDAAAARTNLGLGTLSTLSSVGQAQIASNAVGQGELKATSGGVSTISSTPVTLTLPGGAYGFYPRLYADSESSSCTWENPTTISTSQITVIALSSGAGFPAVANQTYIQASPPDDLGYGEIGRFVFATIINSTGKVESTYDAKAAPWHYNGKTNIQTAKIINGVKYRMRRDMSGLPFILKEVIDDPTRLNEYILAFNSAPIVYEEITNELKQKDMKDIPHPFLGNDLTGRTIVLLDPACDLMHRLNELCECHDEFSLCELLYGGYLNISNTELDVRTPRGVKTVKFSMKNTRDK